MYLKVNDIKVNINGREIIKDISFDIKKEQLTAILGLNGAGKTTLIKTLVGITRPNSGNIRVDDRNIFEISNKERAKLFSYVPQNTTPEINYSVLEFVLMGVTPYLGLFETPSKKHYLDAKEAIEMLNLKSIEHKYLNEISGGERQRVFLARALVQKSDIMILDEPTAHLDFKRQHNFMCLLKKLVTKTRKCVVLSMHDPNLALKYADRIIIIHDNTLNSIIECTGENFPEKLVEKLNIIYNKKISVIKHKGNNILYLDN